MIVSLARRERTFMLRSGMRLLASVSLAIAVLVLACAPNISDPGPTLSEKLGIELQFPIPEEEFLELMNSRSIATERRGPGSPTFQTIPRRSGVDLEAMGVDHAYSVYTGMNAPAGRSEQYIAYVDANDDIIRVERDFAYIAP
ncbi:MAG: hypothetical protein IV086_18170 [Hyphomonadaceae bacterium]|nr:hypothetical protein [Hyphomonadaceae bacterium]